MNPIVEKVYQIGIIPVIAFNSVDEALPLCKALAEGGLPAAEVTFRTACAEECIRKIHEEMPEMLLGAGTQQHFGHLFVDLADALLSTCSAEGDLSCGQAALSQSLAQGQGLINAVESDNRDNADLIDLFYDGIHNAFLLLF